MSLLQVVRLQMTSKTATIQYKPVTSLAGNNKVFAHYKQSHGYDQISHALSNIHGLYGCNCNLPDVISVYSLNPGKLPGCFSYERPVTKAFKLSSVFTKFYTQSPDMFLGSSSSSDCCWFWGGPKGHIVGFGTDPKGILAKGHRKRPSENPAVE